MWYSEEMGTFSTARPFKYNDVSYPASYLQAAYYSGRRNNLPATGGEGRHQVLHAGGYDQNLR